MKKIIAGLALLAFVVSSGWANAQMPDWSTQGAPLANVRVITASGAVTVAKSDYVVVVNKASGAATTVNLPASPATGRLFYIKDGKGDAGTNNITITPASGNIDGSATDVINTNYGGALIVYNGTQWNVLLSTSGLL